MRTCSRCPCTVYVAEMTACFGCLGRESLPPTTHAECSHCGKLICSEHKAPPDSTGLCYTCRNVTLNLAMTSEFRRAPPVPSMFLTEQEEEDRYFRGIYIPSYLGWGKHTPRGKHNPRFTKAIFTRQWKNESCSICWEGFDEDQDFTVLNCKHAFHIECLTQWSRVKSNCPMCRAKITRKT
jgi:hypothetical protein